MRIIVDRGRLFFQLSTGETISCECIRDPYATQIANDFHKTVTEAVQYALTTTKGAGDGKV